MLMGEGQQGMGGREEVLREKTSFDVRHSSAEPHVGLQLRSPRGPDHQLRVAQVGRNGSGI